MPKACRPGAIFALNSDSVCAHCSKFVAIRQYCFSSKKKLKNIRLIMALCPTCGQARGGKQGHGKFGTDQAVPDWSNRPELDSNDGAGGLVGRDPIDTKVKQFSSSLYNYILRILLFTFPSACTSQLSRLRLSDCNPSYPHFICLPCLALLLLLLLLG